MTLPGIDVSNWQKGIDWNAVAGSGVQFAIAKASEGRSRDSYYSGNQAALLAPGPLVGGSYHFFHGDPGEADYYLAQHDPKCFDPQTPWIFALDAEAEGDNPSCQAFMAKVTARVGYKCWFYSYSSWISSHGIQASDNPLWLAWPNPGAPPMHGWASITAIQYGTRSVPGIAGAVDANDFQGDMPTLRLLAGVGAQPAPPPPPPPPPPPQHGIGGKMFSFRPDSGDRHDAVFVTAKGAKLTHMWSNSIGGDADSPGSMGVQSWDAPANVSLVADSAFCSWNSGGNWFVWGAQASNGDWWYGWGDLNGANQSGWKRWGTLTSDVPATAGGSTPAAVTDDSLRAYLKASPNPSSTT